MNRRILSVITAVLGLVAIVLAVCSATVWRPSSSAEASLASAPTEHYVITEPGVLGLVDSDVTVSAKASGSQSVTILVGHTADVKAWLASDPYVDITGLKDWTTLDSHDVTSSCASGATATALASSAASASASATATASTDAKGCTVLKDSNADPRSSDLWLTSATGKGSASIELDATDSDLAVLVVTDGSSAAPTVSLSWPRSVSTPWLVPGLIIGGVLLLVGVFLFLIDVQARHADEQRRARAAERAARLAAADSVATAGIPQVGDPNRPFTRREKRDQERAEAAGEEWIDPRSGRVFLGGVEAPAVPQAPAAQVAETITDSDAVEQVGDARGSAVVPGLSAERTAELRAARGLEDTSPLSFAPAADADEAGAGPRSATAPTGLWGQDDGETNGDDTTPDEEQA